jgi:hypothetical protein
MSVTVPGTFDCGKLLEVKAKVAEIFNGEGVISKEYIPDVEPALAILSSQTANFEVLAQPEKDREVKVYWLDDCDDEDPVDCTDQCSIDGEEIGDQCANYALSECFEKTFTVTEERFRTSLWSREEVVARAMLKKMKLMDEYWAAKAIAFLDASSGINKFAGQYTVSGSTTYVPAVAWNPDIFGYIDTALWMNKLSGGKMLSGTLLKQYMWKVGMETSDPTGASAQAKMTSFGVPYFDRRLDTILGEKALFLWDPNAAALVTKARHEAYGPEGRKVDTDSGPQVHMMTIDSNSLPGVVYDLYYQEVCAANDITHKWKLKTRGDIFLNPQGCDTDRTGVLKFVCGEAP